MSGQKGNCATLTIFRFAGLADRWWAFTGMQLAHRAFRGVDGLRFYKLLGSGAGNGFSAKPDLGRYAFLGSWDNEGRAAAFFRDNRKINEYTDRSVESLTVYLQPVKSHGSWSGEQPFVAAPGMALRDGPVAVITRARIRSSQLIDFWKHVPAVSSDVAAAQGRVFSVGVGEWPWVEQATFSIWEGFSFVQEFAYKRKLHADVVRRTRERNWYSEELFARFVPYRLEGEMSGLDRSKLVDLGVHCV